MLGVTGLLMEMSKELSPDAGRTESVCPGHRAAGNPGGNGNREERLLLPCRSQACSIAEQLCGRWRGKPGNGILRINIARVLSILRRGFT